MRRINGSGSVYRLKDTARRKPWVASVSGRDAEGFSFRHVIGTFETKKDAVSALESYNVMPYRLDTRGMTFSGLHSAWLREAEQKYAPKSLKLFASAFNACVPLYDLPVLSIRNSDLQNFLDSCGRSSAMLEAVRKMITSMFQYALKNDVVIRDPSLHLVIPKRAAPSKKNPHVPYTDEEINILWEHSDDQMAAFQLILIYSGARIGEMLDLSFSDVDLDAQRFVIRQAKTKAGVRTVPIADRVLPLWRSVVGSRSSFVVGDTGRKPEYQETVNLWRRFNETVGISHLPHDCRHTSITRMASAGVDSVIIKKIVGHKALDVTEDVYMHAPFDVMLEAVNKI